MPKYWLDGIFDEEFIEVKVEEIVEVEDEEFIISDKFNGSKDGYCFKLGEKGLGYYRLSGFKIPVKKIVEVKVEVKDENDFIRSENPNENIDGYSFRLGIKGFGYYRLSSIQFSSSSSVKEIVLCKNYKYCSNPKCHNRHWYNVRNSNRMSEYNANPEYCEKEEKEALTRAISRFRREGYITIVE
jgi:hypothetical protein